MLWNNWFIRQLCVYRDMKMIWRWYEDDMKMIWRWYEDDMKMVWRCLKMPEVPRSVASSNSYASFVLSKLPKCFISQWTHSWRVNQWLREEMEVARTVHSYEGEPRASNEDVDEDWQDGVSPVAFRSRFEQEIPQPFIPSHYVRRSFPSVIALEFRWCREIPLVTKS